MNERETFLLGGRAFARVEDMTVEQDLFVMGALRKGGLDQLTLLHGESTDDFAHRVLSDLAASGKALPLLAALIEPVDAPTWSPAAAENTAAFIATLKEPLDKARVNTLIVSMLLGFFVSGIVSLHEFKRSLDESIANDPSTKNETTDANGSASGQPPSAQSQEIDPISSGV